MCSTLFAEPNAQIKNPRQAADSLFREFKYEAAEIALTSWIKEKATPGDYYFLSRIQAKQKKNKKSLSNLEISMRLFSIKNELPFALDVYEEEEFKEFRNEPLFRNLLERYYTRREVNFLYAKEISYDELTQYMKSFLSGNSVEGGIRVNNKLIYWKKIGNQYIWNDVTRPLDLPDLEIFEKEGLFFRDCTFKINLILAQQKSSIRAHPFHNLRFFKCSFEGRVLLANLEFHSKSTIAAVDGGYVGTLDFTDSKFKEQLFVLSKTIGIGYVMISRCQLKDLFINMIGGRANNLLISDNSFADSTEIELFVKDDEGIRILKNSMAGSTVEIKSNVKNLIFESNEAGYLILESSEMPGKVIFNDNTIHQKLLFPESLTTSQSLGNIPWSELGDFKIGLFRRLPWNNLFILTDSIIFNDLKDFQREPYQPFLPEDIIAGERKEDFQEPNSYRSLLRLYSVFLQGYKNNMDLESYNNCFVMIKQLQTSRLRYLYISNPNFQTYFSWRLSQLLKFYVNHGTEPARAIVISIFIILGFGIFFFFFPSDWDTTSKKNLLLNFKDFIGKNDKGYFKPFLLLVGGFALSLANAITLSLNAFITLGFGNIPTRGIARYVCVLEGFMGWFLLSIFTVALINQVL